MKRIEPSFKSYCLVSQLPAVSINLPLVRLNFDFHFNSNSKASRGTKFDYDVAILPVVTQVTR